MSAIYILVGSQLLAPQCGRWREPEKVLCFPFPALVEVVEELADRFTHGRLGPRCLTTIGWEGKGIAALSVLKVHIRKIQKVYPHPWPHQIHFVHWWLSVWGRGQGASWRPGQRGQFLDFIMFLSLLPTNSEIESSLNTLLLSTVTYPVRAC